MMLFSPNMMPYTYVGLHVIYIVCIYTQSYLSNRTHRTAFIVPRLQHMIQVVFNAVQCACVGELVAACVG